MVFDLRARNEKSVKIHKKINLANITGKVIMEWRLIIIVTSCHLSEIWLGENAL